MSPEDLAFAEAVENCTFPGADFHHREHVRLAWVYLRRFGAELAEQRVEETIRRYATAQGAPQKYHHTITLAWMRLVEAAQESNPAGGFPEFAAEHPELFRAEALERHYSKARLQTEEARTGFVEPDRAPLRE